MSRRTERCLLWGELIALLLVPSDARCQEAGPARQARTDVDVQAAVATRVPTDEEAALVRAIDELLPRIGEASDHAAEMDDLIDAAREQRSRQTVDTMRVSAWTVFASERDADAAVRAFRKVEPDFEWAEGLPAASRRFTVTRWRSVTRPIVVDGVDSRLVGVSGFRGQRALERKVREELAHAVGSALPPPLRVWTQNSPVRPTISNRERSRMFRELRMTPSLATRSCVAGNLEGCRAALGLVESPLAQGEAFDPDQFDAVARYRMHRVVDPGCAGPGVAALTADGGSRADLDQAADCLAWWEDGSNWTQAIPLHGVTRAAFLGFVLARSGPTAIEDFRRGWEELAGDGDGAAPGLVTAHLVTLLEQVSRRPIDNLVSDFREQIMSGRTERAATPGTDGLGVLFWVLLSAALASRSTRWRLG